jgi:uncharacterized Zn finger protein
LILAGDIIMSWYFQYKPYVPVAQRRAQAEREIARRRKKGETITPVKIEGRKITTTFWGNAWCQNLESYSDYANRLPRGRTYVNNGSVVHLQIAPGRITALVSGSELYEIRIDIEPLPKARWQALKKQCAGQIGSLVELLQGRLSKGVMERVTDRTDGLFPRPREIKMRCSCPDSAGLCKHLAAVMYGVGHRLDSQPALLFQLRGVDHQELIEEALPSAPAKQRGQGTTLDEENLGDIFGIDLGEQPATPVKPAPRSRKAVATPAPKSSGSQRTSSTPAAKKPAAAPAVKKVTAPAVKKVTAPAVKKVAAPTVKKVAAKKPATVKSKRRSSS